MKIIAHRGFSAAAPENTLSAFRLALDVGAKWIELDYHHTLDGVPVVLHDDELHHCTDAVTIFPQGPHLASRAKLSELRQLNVAAQFRPSAPATTIRATTIRATTVRATTVRAEHIPTLDEALDVILPQATPVIERKAGDVETLVKLLRRRSIVERVIVMAFDWDFVFACREMEPKLQLVTLGDGPIRAEDLNRAMKCKPNRFGWNHENIDEDSLRQFESVGRDLWTYTVNDLARARDLVGWGVEGIITNHPDVMLAELNPSSNG